MMHHYRRTALPSPPQEGLYQPEALTQWLSAYPMTSTPPMRICRYPENTRDPLLLEICKDRSNRMPDSYEQAYQITYNTLNCFFLNKVQTELQTIAPTVKKLKRLLGLVYHIHSRYKVFEPERILIDLMHFGHAPFEGTSDKPLHEYLRKQIQNTPNTHPQMDAVMHHLRGFLAHYEVAPQTAWVWILHHVNAIFPEKLHTLTLTKADPKEKKRSYQIQVLLDKGRAYVLDPTDKQLRHVPEWLKKNNIEDAKTTGRKPTHLDPTTLAETRRILSIVYFRHHGLY